MTRRLLTTAALILFAPAVQAQTPPPSRGTPVPPPAPDPAVGDAADEGEEIVVTGQRERGAVVGNVQPELQLRPADIRALGASNLTDLIAELGPQLRSGRGGQPVTLLEGRRISGFREIAALPPEAIARIDILPEEVALKYGYTADQKVINIVLRQRFRAFTAEVGDRIATEGGANSPQLEGGLLRLFPDGRVNLNAKLETVASLTEAQRDISSSLNDAQFRTLIPRSRDFTLTGVLNKRFDELSATLSGQLETRDTRSTFGSQSGLIVPPDATLLPLGRRGTTTSANAGLTLDRRFGSWQVNTTATYDRDESESRTDRIASNLADRAESTNQVFALNAVAIGSPFRLPAGEVNTTLRAGGSFSRFRSDSTRVAAPSRINRNIADAQFNIDLPIASRRTATLDALGDLSVNGNARLRKFSDFGTLRTLGYGLNWSPLRPVTLIAQFTDEENAPSAQQLGDAIVATPNVRVFDFVANGTALVTQTTGGNPFLRASDRHVVRLFAEASPFTKTDLRFSGEFVRTKTDDPIAALPPASLASQQAFGSRYQRNAAGNLIGVGSRTVNFASSNRSQFRYGLNFSKALKTSQATQDAYRAAFQQRFPNGFPGRGQGGGVGTGGEGGRRSEGGGGRGGGGFGGGGFGGGGQGGGRLTLSAYHTIHLTDRVTFASGQPSVDLLNGGTISGGGQPRHEVEVQAGYSQNGIGARLTGNFQSATRVVGPGGAVGDELKFGSLTTFNLRLFAQPGQFPKLIGKDWLRGVRVTFAVDNLFNRRQRVTDATGSVPLSYQPGYLDPLGRTIRLSVRKLFFTPPPRPVNRPPAAGGDAPAPASGSVAG